jgi:hypothetical protein
VSLRLRWLPGANKFPRVESLPPALFLPPSSKIYLSPDGVERLGPGYTKPRHIVAMLFDPFDLYGLIRKAHHNTKFWEEKEQHPALVYDFGESGECGSRRRPQKVHSWPMRLVHRVHGKASDATETYYYRGLKGMKLEHHYSLALPYVLFAYRCLGTPETRI